MANYSTDSDLVVVAPKILSYGTSDWTTMHTRAKVIIDRVLEVRWYRPEASHRGIDYQVTAFDADLLDSSQLVWLSCYKALELIYQSLQKPDATEDWFERQVRFFDGKFNEELQALLTLGITYDWDEDDSFDETERITPQRRRLTRG